MNNKMFSGTPNKELPGNGLSYQEDINKPLVTLDGEDMYMSLVEEENGVSNREEIEDAKRILDMIKKEFPEEVEACRKLRAKECGEQLKRLLDLLKKN